MDNLKALELTNLKAVWDKETTNDTLI